MLKKVFLIICAVTFSAALCGCAQEEEIIEENEKLWMGQYVMTDEDTGEFKILTVTRESDADVSLTLESVRSSDEFTAPFRSSSGKYAVLNAGDRCLKFNLKSGNTVITVDDMWTNSEAVRNENWSGRYVMLEEGEAPEDFGDTSWNGEYVCSETGLEMSIYCIKKDTVLLTYKEPESDEKSIVKVVCSVEQESGREAVFADEFREIKAEIVAAGREINISDMSEPSENINISGRYIAK